MNNTLDERAKKNFTVRETDYKYTHNLTGESQNAKSTEGHYVSPDFIHYEVKNTTYEMFMQEKKFEKKFNLYIVEPIELVSG